jgi:uncharacterized protein YjbI with pentapeptide repeats
VASNSKRSRDDETKFTEAEKNWNLEKLYEDLRAAKQRCGSAKRKILTDTEKCHLRGLLCRYSPEEIANERGVGFGTVNDALSKTLYCYIEELLDYKKKIRYWENVPDFLEQAGYKIQRSEQFQPNYPLPDEKENILEASHKIGATSFLEYFSKSIDQLKSKDLDVRIGAIATLGTLAKYSSPSEHWTIMEYLAAFIRSNAPWKEEDERSSQLRGDIQAALSVIGGRDLQKNLLNHCLNLSYTNIKMADLTEAKLQGINFFGANLQDAKLFKANLERANLSQAKLQDAVLGIANLREAILFRANLERAFLCQAKLPDTDLREANLERTNFGGANLYRAILFRANLERANLRGAILQEAVFSEAKLQGADFGNANLQYAKLLEADLQGANLNGVNVQGADFRRAKNLTSEQIKLACGDSKTILSENIERPAHWM